MREISIHLDVKPALQLITTTVAILVGFDANKRVDYLNAMGFKVNELLVRLASKKGGLKAIIDDSETRAMIRLVLETNLAEMDKFEKGA